MNISESLPACPPKAYSYVRFSTPEQAKGDSARRQLESAKAYAVEHGLELDDELTFADLGVSAFRSKNSRTGSLSLFFRAVEDGVVPRGSYLLVESFDRISRDDITTALGLLQVIIGAGVYLVTLGDRRIYSRESINANPTDLILALLIMMRANEESTVKSIRLKAAYDSKRATIRSGEPQVKPFTRRLPAWIGWNDSARAFELIEGRAPIIQQVFALADSGCGKKFISTTLNETGVKPFGGAEFWHASYIGKLLVNPACVGTFIPRARQNVDGQSQRVSQEPIVNYWPAAVELEVYERVSSRFTTVSPRGPHSLRLASSVVAGVAQCAVCGSAFIRVSKPPHVYLVCTRAHAKASCEYLAVRYQDVESSLVTHIDALIDGAPSAQGMDGLESSLFGLDQKYDDLTYSLNEYLDDYRLTKSEAIRLRAAHVERELNEVRSEGLRLRAEKVRLASPHVTRRLQRLRDCFKTNPLDVPVANRALRDCVKTLSIDARRGRIDIEWHHGSSLQEAIPFRSRHVRSAFPECADEAGDVIQSVETTAA